MPEVFGGTHIQTGLQLGPVLVGYFLVGLSPEVIFAFTQLSPAMCAGA